MTSLCFVLNNLQFKNVIMILTNEIKEILENVTFWDSCPQDYKDKINEYLNSENDTKALNIDLVMISVADVIKKFNGTIDDSEFALWLEAKKSNES